ncbi:S-methylmethionine--homocysteine S-methyltransferase BHMT2-like isoform X2 [Ostrea edulis]|nr:S-methylmethionine--homocysteine S-methyltransferase BHMT2-like isoform X2 [Ostrea edulis]
MAGNICNTTVYERGNDEAVEAAKEMFKEQIQWAVECGADYIVAETFSDYGEAELALRCIKEYGKGLPAVVSLVAHSKEETVDGLTFPDACRKLEEAGADVVGLNCCRGPKTMMPLIREIRKVCKGPICMLPVPYRTTPEQPTMQSLKDAETDKQAFPFDLPAFACSRTQIAEFAREAKEVGVQYIGLCCGNASHYIRVVAEEYGRYPPASKFSPDMSEHFIFGDREHVKDHHATSYLPNM